MEKLSVINGNNNTDMRKDRFNVYLRSEKLNIKNNMRVLSAYKLNLKIIINKYTQQ